ncbi:hypothetical protein [Undibacterium luofuense]|uniref:hypothetical protein n=1 Tax=Undibacterium luofuense TaxID=2828733 RepID=UPI0030ED8705
MKLSRFFDDLMAVYQAEIEDLKSDSEGKNVLKARLREKAQQLPLLLPMMDSNPEMLAPAFHQAFIFMNPLALEGVISKEAHQLPAWSALTKSVRLEPWAEALAKLVLKEEGGDRFLVIAAALEYLLRGHRGAQTAAPQSEQDEDDEDGGDDDYDGDDGNVGRYGRDDGDDGDDRDLDEAGADWLVEQGFDRKE